MNKTIKTKQKNKKFSEFKHIWNKKINRHAQHILFFLDTVKRDTLAFMELAT